MKTGKTLIEMATELQRRAEAKEDFLAPTRKLEMVSSEGVTTLHTELGGGQERAFAVTDHTHRQIGTWTGIPAKYYSRLMEEAPELLTDNVNHWLQKSGKNRLVRTLDGTARAFLSDRYRRIDNEDIAEQVLPILMDSGNFSEIISTEVTDRRMYIKALFPKMKGEIGLNDEVQAGVIISNSEIGMGSLSIQPLIYRLVCLNGMISQDHGLSRYHVGKQIQGDGEAAFSLFADETLATDDKALMLKVRDIVRAASQREVFDAIIAKMREAQEGPKLEKPVEAVELLSKNFGFNEGEKMSVLENLIRGGDYSRFGVLNAVTATANTHESYDRATEFEHLGGKILDLPKSDWKVLTEAA